MDGGLHSVLLGSKPQCLRLSCQAAQQLQTWAVSRSIAVAPARQGPLQMAKAADQAPWGKLGCPGPEAGPL